MLKSAKLYNESFGFNILPLIDKVPLGDWTQWQTAIMTPEDIKSFNWRKVNGIGAVCGINRLRCFDFDSVADESLVKKFLRALGLPSEYAWTVRSGSGKGYHIWFYSDNDSYLFRILGGEKSYYKLLPKALTLTLSQRERELEKVCDHIELRWSKCQTVLPPSLHPSGKQYEFLFTKQIPSYAPYNVPTGRLTDTLEQFCILSSSSQSKSETHKENKKPVSVNISSIQSIAEYLEGRINNYHDWFNIGFALASLGEQGREYFLKISNNPKYNDTPDELNRKFSGFIKDYRGDITIASLYEIAKQYGYVKPVKYFWDVNNNKAKIYTNLLIEFLEKSGFSKMFVNKDYMYIKDEANIISEVSKVNMKDFIIEYINMNTKGIERELILERFIGKATQYCNDGTLECLRTVIPFFMGDTKTTVYFYFSNCYIEVTKSGIKQKDYSEVHGKIWEKQKAKHEFHLTAAKSEFQVFINNVCRSDSERINSLRSAIGYLLSTYKDPSCAKAVIFNDEKLSEGASGRSGKGLVAKAIGHMRNMLQIDGKNFKFDKAFNFQSVEPDTQIIFFDDVKKRFHFENLFSILTEGMTVEKKNKNEMRMPYKNSPKVLLTTNHTIEGFDDSALDRQFVIEFSDFYNSRHKPQDDFKHQFFEDWTEEQWNAFYNYMAECCRYYLVNGLKPYIHVNLLKKKLIDGTCPEFEEYIRSILFYKEYNRKEVIEDFRNQYPDYANVRQNTFTRWMKLYSELYNLEIVSRRSGTETFIKFISKEDISSGNLETLNPSF